MIYKILKKLVKKVNKSNNKKIISLEFTIETLINFAKTKKELGEYLNIEKGNINVKVKSR